MFSFRSAVASVAAIALPALAGAQAPLLLRSPSVSADQICFSFAGDLWLVPRAGGSARRLTASPGTETDCRFSADGKWVAYTGVRNNNADVYVVATAGGTPKRLSYHPASDYARGWTPDGKVLFTSNRLGEVSGGSAPPRLFVQGVNDVVATVVDLPSGFDGSFSADGQRLAYMPIINANDIWKRYRGGRTTPIWIARMSDASIERIPRDSSTDKTPMWVGDTVYFLSDRDGATTLYAYDVSARRVARRVDNRGLDIKSASAGPGAIVYEQFGGIMLYDTRSGQSRPVPIQIDGELTAALPRWVPVASKLKNAAISPSGARVAFEARGEIITVPAKKGDARNITQSTDVVERSPSWSPDGQTIAFFSDAARGEAGGYHLELRDQNGRAAPRSIPLGGDDVYYYAPVWSPDGRMISFSNSRGEISYVDVATGKVTKVDTDPAGPRGAGSVLFGGLGLSWSPDSKWIAYGRTIRNRLSAVFVYDVARAASTQVTDGMSDAKLPAFDASGKYLYFVASTDAGPASDFSMMTYDHPVTSSLYAVVLRKDLPSPMAPESDEEKGKDAAAAPGAPGGAVTGAKPDTAKKSIDVRIDFDAIDQRIVALPAAARNYVGLGAGKAGIVILAEAPLIPLTQLTGQEGLTIHKFDLTERKTDKLVENVGEFDLSRDGEKLVYKLQGKWTIIPVTAPAKPGEGMLATGDIQVETDPRAEWRQMYREAFRVQRAFFYDPNYHGLDLAATERFYAKYLDGMGSRADLDYLFQEIFGNLTVGHLFVFNTEPDQSTAVSPPANGVLGADYVADNGRWKFGRVYAGENWNPQFRAPLTQPGVNVTAGEYLLAVNGRDVTTATSVDEALEGTAGKSVVLRVGPSANGAGARDVTVVPLATEAELRHLAWIDNNRRTVDRLSGGKLAYIYVPNTAIQGFSRFNRYFFAQQDRQGAVVDERFNGGGNIADYMVEYLRRDAPFNYVTSRYGEDAPIPAGAIYGPKVMLINEYAGSGGDELPWLFKRFKVGQLVGKRTWGGLVGIGGYPQLMDGTTVTAPRIALWSAEGEYAVENRGVAPDVEVDIEPAAWRAGHDTQVERAVSILMQPGVMQAGAPAKGKRPPFPTWAQGKTPRDQ